MTRELRVIVDGGVLRPLEALPFTDQQQLVATLWDGVKEPLPTPLNPRKLEMEWIQANTPNYRGKWVALQGSELVACGTDGAAVLEEARATGVPRPLLYHVPKDDLPFGGW